MDDSFVVCGHEAGWIKSKFARCGDFLIVQRDPLRIQADTQAFVLDKSVWAQFRPVAIRAQHGDMRQKNRENGRGSVEAYM